MSKYVAYYHVTEKKNVQSIMKRGLIPKYPRVPRERIKAMFFRDTLERAQMMTSPGDVIIEVQVPTRCQMYARRNEAGYLTKTEAWEYFVYQTIPAERLKIVYEEPSLE